MRYNTPNSPIDNIRDFVFRGGIPFTMTMLIISVLTFLASFYSGYSGFVTNFFATNVIFTGFHPMTPWTILTYPLFPGQDFISLLISGVFFWLTGGSLERSWGSSRFAISFFALAAITALSMALGETLFARSVVPIVLMGFSMPLAGLIVAFCMLNPEQTIILYFFPIRAKYVALIVTLLTYFQHGAIMGFFACGGILAAFLYVTYGRSWNTTGYASRQSRFGGDSKILRMDHPRFQTKPPSYLDGSPRERSIFDIVGRWRAWQERKRLEQLLKNSGFSDREPDWRDDEGRRRP